MAAACALAALAPATAASSPAYASAVGQARSILAGAPDGDRAGAARAARALEAGTGSAQPEIIADLRADPPRLADARSRLGILAAALAHPAGTPDPARARRQLARIMALPRYRGLARGPSPWNSVLAWLVGLALMLLLGAGRLGAALEVAFGAACLLVLLGAAAWVVRGARNRGRGDVRSRPEATQAHGPPDLFRLAEDRAASGDYAGAVRALAVGVAGRVAGDPEWETTPLTVREAFAKAERPELLRPLLVPFEEAVYGRRLLGRESYLEAQRSAGPYRPPEPASR